MRLRFAPSPTGFLHIGNARTAVANFLISKKTGASMVLRIEDTDMERSSRESELSIYNDLHWLGIDWHEGPDKGGDHGPYRQSERFDIYQKYTERLLAEGKAYHCYCSQEELDSLRKKAELAGSAFEYPGTCRSLTPAQKKAFEDAGRKPTVRFRVPENISITVNDLIKGPVQFSSGNIGGDFILVRSDGYPIYNYIVVIDDAEMEITHVIRGEDHLPNTPKQMLIGQALDLPVPAYAHLALVLGPDRSKMSKRHGITSVQAYRQEGYLPGALFNYLAMLGWSAEEGQEILTIDEIVAQIELDNLAKSAAVFDFQKLKWLNAQYIRNLAPEEAMKLLLPYIHEAGYDTASVPADRFEKIIAVVRNYCDVLSDVKKYIGMFLDTVHTPDDESDALLREDYAKKVITAAAELIVADITHENIAADLVGKIKEKTGLKGKNLFHPIRALITGRLKGPELDIAIPLIGFDRCRERIEYCFKKYV